MKSNLKFIFAIVMLFGSLIACGISAQSAPTATAVLPTLGPTTIAPATESPVSVQDSGPKIITGNVSYTNTFFTEGVAEPEIILEDEVVLLPEIVNL